MMDETGFAVKKISSEEWSDWDAFVFQQKEGTIFHTSHWLKHQPNRKLEIHVLLDHGSIVGGIPLSIVNKAGFRVVALPIMTPYSGPVLADSLYFKHGRLEAFRQLTALLTTYDAWRYKLSPKSDAEHYTKETKEIKQHRRTNLIVFGAEKPEYASSLKRNLKKAEKAGIEIKESTDFESVYDLSAKSFRYSGRKHPLSKKNFIELANALHEVGLATGRLAFSEEGKPIACNWLPKDHHTTYNIIHGIDRAFKDTQAGAALLHESIQQAQANKLHFDFEGSSAERIHRFYQKFGSEERKIIEVNAINNRMISLLSRIGLVRV